MLLMAINFCFLFRMIPDVFVQLFFVLFGNEILPTLHGEDDMNVDLGIGICHFLLPCDKLHATPTEFS